MINSRLHHASGRPILERGLPLEDQRTLAALAVFAGLPIYEAHVTDRDENPFTVTWTTDSDGTLLESFEHARL